MPRLTVPTMHPPASASRTCHRSRSLRAVLVLGAALPLLGACGLFGGRAKACHEPQAYEQAQSVPPLKSPEGTPVPATRSALKIPEVAQTTKERAATDPCLDEPPSFYPGRPKPGQGTPAQKD